MDTKKSEKAPSKTNGLGVASLVLAVVSIIFLLLPYFGIILAILAIVFSIIQKKRNPVRIATIGLVIGIIGFVLNLIMLIVVIGVIAYFFNAPDTAILGENIQLFRIVFNGKFSPNGYVNVPFLKDSTKYEFINIVVDFNKDGKFERYPITNGYQEEWVIQNMAVKTLKDQPNSFSVLMPDQSIDGRKDFETRIILNKKKLEDWSKSNAADAFHKLIITEVKKEDAGKYYKPDPEGIRSGGLPLGAVSSGNLIPGTTKDTLTAHAFMYLVSAASDILNVFRGDVPDINQGFNECVPTSATNALMWLADHYGFADKIPANSRDLIDELILDLQWDEFGVNVQKNYLDGINKFAERHSIPLKSYQVGQNYDTTIVSKIADELNKGNSVLLDMEYITYDAAGNPYRAGGHMVTVVGVSDTENGQYLYINDPLSQIPGVDVYKVEGNKVLNYRFEGNTQTIIRSAIAEASTVPAVKPIDSLKAPQQPVTPATKEPAVIIKEEQGERGQVAPVITDEEDTTPRETLRYIITLSLSATDKYHDSPVQDWQNDVQGESRLSVTVTFPEVSLEKAPRGYSSGSEIQYGKGKLTYSCSATITDSQGEKKETRDSFETMADFSISLNHYNQIEYFFGGGEGIDPYIAVDKREKMQITNCDSGLGSPLFEDEILIDIFNIGKGRFAERPDQPLGTPDQLLKTDGETAQLSGQTTVGILSTQHIIDYSGALEFKPIK